MRFPVFARNSANPSTDRPIVRKSLCYLKLQVAQLLADWVDTADHSKGIVVREIVYFGPRRSFGRDEYVPETSSASVEFGLRFVLPASARHEILVTHPCRLDRKEAGAWAHEARSLRARRRHANLASASSL